MKVSLKLRVCLLSAQLLICCRAVRATTLERMPLARMVQAAQVIVRARCVSNSTAWDAGEIWTHTTFKVEEAWKSPSGSQLPGTIAVRLLGGTVGALTSHVSGVPRFRPGEDVLIFLEPTSRGDFSVAGWAQGTFRIRRDPRSGERTVTQDTAAFATFNPRSRRFEATGIRNLPLETLREQVESAIARNGE